MTEFARRREKKPEFEDIPVITGREPAPVKVKPPATALVERHQLVPVEGSFEAQLQTGGDKVYNRDAVRTDPFIEDMRLRAEHADKPKTVTTYNPPVEPLPEKPVAQIDIGASVDGEQAGDHQAWRYADKKPKDKVIRGR